LQGGRLPTDKWEWYFLMQHYGAQTYRDCLLAAAKAHVPGFTPASPMRSGGRPRKAVKIEKAIKPSPMLKVSFVREREARLKRNVEHEAAENEALLREHIDFRRERGESVEDIVKSVSTTKANYFCGFGTEYLTQLYWDPRYQMAADNRTARIMLRFFEWLKTRSLHLKKS